MDWNQEQNDSSPSVQCLNFNQDFSCLAVGTANDYRIFNCDPFGECFKKSDDGGASHIEMLFSTSLIAVVGTGDKGINNSPRRLKLINTKRKTVICELTFSSPILNVKLNRKRLVVVLIDQVFLYDVSCMKLLHTIEISRNPNGLVALSLNDASILAYPAPSHGFQNLSSPLSDVVSSDSNLTLDSSNGNLENGNNYSHYHHHHHGAIIIYDALNLQAINVIVAHKTELATMSLNNEGSLIATASNKGTIVRVFDTQSGRKIGEFRRGMAGTLIHSLNFNFDSTLLCSSSNNQTIHIFKIGTDNVLPSSPESITRESEEGNELYRTSTSSSSSSKSHDNSSNNNESSPIDEALINNLLLTKKKKAPSISGFIWNKSKKISSKIINNYLPQQLSSILEPVRHFAFIKLPKSGAMIDKEGNELSNEINKNYKNIVALSHNSSYVMIATNDGIFYIYNVPLEKGGECELVKQYSLL